MKRAFLTLGLSLCAVVSQVVLINQAEAQISPTETRLSVVSWGPGRLDIFVSKKIPNSTSSRIWVKSFQNGWTNWSSIAVIPANPGFPAVASVDAVSWGPGRIDLFMAANTSTESGRTESVWHKYLDTSIESGWRPYDPAGEYLGGTNTQDFTVGGTQAVSWGSNRFDLFSRYPDDGPFLHKYWNGSAWRPSQTRWSLMESAAFPSADGYFVVASAYQQLEVFRSQHGYIEHRRYDGVTNSFVTPWTSMNGGMSYDMPYAVSPPGGGPVEVFVRGRDYAVWRCRYEGGVYDGWYWMGTGNTQSRGDAVSAVSWGPNRVDVFETKSDYSPSPVPGTIFHKWRDGSTWGPSGIGGAWVNLGSAPFNFAPEAVAWGPSRIDLFGLGNDGVVYHKWTNDGTNWGPSQTNWESLGGPPNI
ncbi:MAG TPA: hypothetical protein VFX02_13895 [Gammaproteobacteria bacterium]|nr:hypothetical protein [Gammaproteobacteria bacterium]